MRNKKLISMLLLPAAFVACTDDFIDGDGFVSNNSKEVVEDMVLNVSFEADNFSRAAYAGDSLGNPYQNFYLAPAFQNDELALSDNKDLKGDMLGYCLSNGANAITNLPFYIAGYASTPDTEEGAKTTIYTFDDQSSANSLYYLGLDDKKYNTEVFTKVDFDASVKAIAEKPANKALDADELDARMGIVRTNAGIMTGNYVAYFPYNNAWTEPSGIPAVRMNALYDVENLSETRNEALSAVNFYDYLFAVSQQANEVKGGTKAGDVSLKPLTSALTFKLVYTKKFEKDGSDVTTDSIKRITIKTIEEGAAGFTLEGKVPMNSLNTIAASKSTDLIGVSFDEVELDTASVKYVTIPFYPNPAITGYVIEVYNNKGQVAAIEKSTANFELGKGYLTTIDFKDLTFKATTRKIFSEEDFIDEALAGGDLMLMTDINVTKATDTYAKDLNIKGAKKLTLTSGTYTGKLTMAEGSHLVLNGASVKAIAADTLSVNAMTEFDASKNLTANTLNVNYSTTFANAEIGVANVACDKQLVVAPVKANDAGKGGTNVSITTLNNKGNFLVQGTTATIVGTLNNLGNAVAEGEEKNAQILVSGPLTVTIINNAAGVKDDPNTKNVNEEVKEAAVDVNAEINSSAVINNNGSLSWGNADITPTINNNGVFYTFEDVNFKGILNNAGNFTVGSKIEGTEGEVNNAAGGVINIRGYFGFTTTKLNINAGQVIVNGSVNGNSNITVTEGAEFIATAANENVLLSTLGTSFINAKYTGIKVTSPTWPLTVLTTDKKIYLNGDITFSKATALNGGLVIEKNAKVKAENLELTTTSITINAGKKLEVLSKTNVTVSGTITNNGTYQQAADAVVWCNGIVTGTGANWINKPNY